MPEIQTYEEWLASHFKPLGLEELSKEMKKLLERTDVKDIPVCDNVAFRKLPLEQLKDDENLKIEPLTAPDGFWVGLTSGTNPAKLQRLFSKKEDCEAEAEDMNYSETTVVPFDLSNALKNDKKTLDKVAKYLVCFEPGGFPDSKEIPIVPPALEAKGYYPVTLSGNPILEGQIWVLVPEAPYKYALQIELATLALHFYGALNPLDLPNIIAECNSTAPVEACKDFLNLLAQVLGKETKEEQEAREAQEEKRKEMAKHIRLASEDDEDEDDGFTLLGATENVEAGSDDNSDKAAKSSNRKSKSKTNNKSRKGRGRKSKKRGVCEMIGFRK